MNGFPSNEPYFDRIKACAHKFAPWFGPVLRCAKCGSQTMVTMDKNESKPIYPPAKDRSA